MKDRCKNGHAMTHENVYTDPRGVKYCRTCERERSRRRTGYKGNLPTGKRTHCPKGHDYSLVGYIDSKGSRHCKICHKLRERKRRGKTENVIPFKERTTCPSGHHYNLSNTGYDKRGHRYCKRCVSLRTLKRRDMKRNLDSNYTPADERFTRLLFSERCFNCSSYDNLEIDHHYPLSEGFALETDNAVLLCKRCNCSKGNRLPQDFYSKEQLDAVDYLLCFAAF